MDKLESLRLRAIALRSSVHNEHQLSAIELSAMCAKKTNELIEVINELVDHMNALLAYNGVTFEYNEETEELQIKGV